MQTAAQLKRVESSVIDAAVPGVSEAVRRGVYVVIAAYNEAAVIAGVVARVRRMYPNVVVVDDGSSDGTVGALDGSGVVVLRHAINRGQGAALQTGIAFALQRGAQVVVTFDADGQHNEGDIDRLVGPVVAGECDVTVGSRFLGSVEGMPFTRKLLLRAAVLFTRVISRVRLTDTHNGIRAFSRRAASSLRITMDRMAHASEILQQIGENRWRYQEVPVHISYSEYSKSKGQSSWNALRIAAQILIRQASR